MLELMGFGALAILALTVLGLLWAVASLVIWLVVLPFKLLAFVFRGLAVLLALPFMLLFGVVGAILFGAGLVAFLIPALPIILLIGLVVWLVRRSHRSTASVAS